MAAWRHLYLYQQHLHKSREEIAAPCGWGGVGVGGVDVGGLGGRCWWIGGDGGLGGGYWEIGSGGGGRSSSYHFLGHFY